MAGNEAVLLAEADSPAAKTDAKPASEDRCESGSEADAKASKTAKPAAKTDAKPQAKAAKNESQAGQGLRGKRRSETKVDAAAADSTSQQTFQATLTLSSTVAKLKDDKVTHVEQPVRYDEDRLKKLVEQALKENKIPVDLVRIELNAPEGMKKSDRWDLKLAPSSEAKTR